jgi:transcriptional regulator with XRE-family HTH domain
MSLKDVERATGVNASRLCRYERATANLSYESCLALARFFGTQDDFFYRTPKVSMTAVRLAQDKKLLDPGRRVLPGEKTGRPRKAPPK